MTERASTLPPNATRGRTAACLVCSLSVGKSGVVLRPELVMRLRYLRRRQIWPAAVSFKYMRQIVPLSGGIGLTFALASGLLFGCATSRSPNQAAALALSYEQFDQTFGSGWRLLFERREYGAAAGLIEEYLRIHSELTTGQQKFLHLHAGMLFAWEGRTARAVQQLDEATTSSRLPELWPDWNDYVTANRAFLVHDRVGLESARDRCAASHSPRLAQVERLVQVFGSSYADWYWWARVCLSVVIPENSLPEHRAAAEKLAQALNASFSVSDSGPQPSCVWVEMRDFAPKSSAMGYIILHSPDGTQITASNPYWLSAAVERFIKSSRVSHGFREAPFGLTTSFNLGLTAKDANKHESDSDRSNAELQFHAPGFGVGLGGAWHTGVAGAALGPTAEPIDLLIHRLCQRNRLRQRG